MEKFNAFLAKAQIECNNFYCQLQELEQTLTSLAVLAGASPSTKGQNAVKAIEKKLNELNDAYTIAEKLGYKSLPYALYGLKKKNRWEHIPQDLRIAPPHWMEERKIEEEIYWRDGRRHFKSVIKPEVTAVQAQRRLQALFPLLDELLDQADEELITSVRDAFFKMSYRTFSKALLEALSDERSQIRFTNPELEEGYDITTEVSII